MKNQFYKNFCVSTWIYIFAAISLHGCSQGPQSNPYTPADYPEHETDSAKLYLSRCSGCHAAPMPNQHTARQWPGVVERMQMRMKNKAVQPLNSSELTVVLDYLQNHARK